MILQPESHIWRGSSNLHFQTRCERSIIGIHWNTNITVNVCVKTNKKLVYLKKLSNFKLNHCGGWSDHIQNITLCLMVKNTGSDCSHPQLRCCSALPHLWHPSCQNEFTCITANVMFLRGREEGSPNMQDSTIKKNPLTLMKMNTIQN